MTIEEKANAYDEALKKAKKLYEQGTITESLNYVFPGLKESDDERMKREAISIVKQYSLICERDGDKCYTADRVIAWLEKQGTSFTKKDVDDAYLKGATDIKNVLEKQGEQKPITDTKVIIPKFRVGDIVKSKSQPMLSPRKITSINKDCYLCEDMGCIGFAWENDYEIVEQNPAWSEEDEKIKNLIIKTLISMGTINLERYYHMNLDEVKKWLKSLKDRLKGE